MFITHYTELYGANKSLTNLIEGLRVSGSAQVLLIAPAEGKVTEWARRRGVKYQVIPFHNEIYYGIRTGFLTKLKDFTKDVVKFILNWYQVIRYAGLARSYDIIHSNSSATLMGAYMAAWARRPHVWHIREFGWKDYRLVYNFGKRYFRFWLNKASVAISISKAIYEENVKCSIVELKPVINNGIMPSASLLAREEALKRSVVTAGNQLTFGIVGALVPGKNQLEALKAFNLLGKELPQTRLLIVGEGDVSYENLLKSYVREHQLEKQVFFTGYKEQIDDVYEEIDCLLMCSPNEAFGRVTVEAMSFGIVVIGFANAGTKEIISDSYNGLLYENGYPELHTRMNYLCNCAPDLFRALQENAIASCYEYTNEKNVEAISTLYDQLNLS